MSFSWKTARKFWLVSVHVEHNGFLSRECITFLAATTKYDKRCGLNNKRSLSHSSGSYNSKIKVSPRLAPPEDYETGLIPCLSPGFWQFLGGNLWRCYDMCHSSLPLSPLGILFVCLWLSLNSPACKNSSHFGLGPPKRLYLQIMSHSGVQGWALQHMSFVVQLLSHVQLFATPWTSAHQASLSITISWSLPKLTSIESVVLSDYLILCQPLLLLPSIFPSISLFQWVLHIRDPKYWSFSFSVSPSNEYSGLISFWTDWFDLLAVQGTLKSLFQHHSSKASILQHSVFSWSNSYSCTWLLEKP